MRRPTPCFAAAGLAPTISSQSGLSMSCESESERDRVRDRPRQIPGPGAGPRGTRQRSTVTRHVSGTVGPVLDPIFSLRRGSGSNRERPPSWRSARQPRQTGTRPWRSRAGSADLETVAAHVRAGEDATIAARSELGLTTDRRRAVPAAGGARALREPGACVHARRSPESPRPVEPLAARDLRRPAHRARSNRRAAPKPRTRA